MAEGAARDRAWGAAIDHAPAIALIRAEVPEQALRAGAACWAGGFRLTALSAQIPSAPDILSALGARADLLVGLWGIDSVDALDAFDLGRVAFAFGSLEGAEGVQTLEDTGVPFIPTCRDLEQARAKLEGGTSTLCLEEVSSLGGPAAVADLIRSNPGAQIFCAGGIGGDELAPYIEAGARGLILTNALMSPSLLSRGDYRSVRNYAAAVHQEATRLGRTSTERMG